MNPFYVPAIILGTASALVLKAYDDGKTSSPPANIIGQMLTATIASTTATATATLVVVDTIIGAVYDTQFGRTLAGTVEGSDGTR